MRYAPELNTPRLSLRAHSLADFAECAAMWADPVVVQHIGGRPATEEEAWTRVLRYAGLWSLVGYGYWVVRERETGRYVGDVGLADFHRAIVPRFEGPEVGWALAVWAHGRGFATEAVSAILAWSDEQLIDAPSTSCLIDPSNTASARVAVKCGFEHVGPASYKGECTQVYRRWRSTSR